MSAERTLLLNPDAQAGLTVSLYREGFFGIKEDPKDYIQLKSERMSPHYLDVRPGISDVEFRELLAGNLVDLANLRAEAKGFDVMEAAYDHIAGTPEAMTSYAMLIAHMAAMSLLQPRVDMMKQTGNKTPIFGTYKEGDKVAEFDDVVTDGKSKIDTIKGLLAMELVVEDYFVVVDREEGGAPQVKEVTGIEITPALSVSGMVKILQEESLISSTKFDNVAEYMNQYGDPTAKAALGLVA